MRSIVFGNTENPGIYTLQFQNCYHILFYLLSYLLLVKVQLGDDYYPAAIGSIRNVRVKTSETDNVIPPSPTEATPTVSTTFDYSLG